MVRLLVLGTYAVAAVAVAVRYGWAWLAVVALLGILPGLALAFLVARGGDWFRDSAGRLYDPERRPRARFWA